MRELALKGLRFLERRARGMRLSLQARRFGDSHTDSPHDDEGWERTYLAVPLEPVTALTSPVAIAMGELTRPGELLLEAGCGSGSISAELATVGRRIELCDFSQKILQRARQLFELSNLHVPKLTKADLTKSLPWADDAVDVTWSSGVLEHWTDEELVPIVREMARVSRRAVISLVPNARCVFYRLGKHLGEQHRLWPYGRELPRRTLKHVFEAAGLHSVREYPVWPEMATSMLSLTEPNLLRIVNQWWQALPADDPVKENQGYLLLTAGYRRPQSGTTLTGNGPETVTRRWTEPSRI